MKSSCASQGCAGALFFSSPGRPRRGRRFRSLATRIVWTRIPAGRSSHLDCRPVTSSRGTGQIATFSISLEPLCILATGLPSFGRDSGSAHAGVPWNLEKWPGDPGPRIRFGLGGRRVWSRGQGLGSEGSRDAETADGCEESEKSRSSEGEANPGTVCDMDQGIPVLRYEGASESS